MIVPETGRTADRSGLADALFTPGLRPALRGNRSCSSSVRTMASAELENLVRIGNLKREPSSQAHSHHCQPGEARLVYAERSALTLESRFDLALKVTQSQS
jgi:hypothetical protein